MLSSVKSPSLARRSVTTYVASLLILAGCLAIGVRLFRDSDRYERQDFNRYYAEASVLRSGGNPWRIFEFSPPKDMNEPAQVGYPPAFYFMFSPLCRFRPATAHWLWEALQIIALISALTIVLREIGRTATNTFIRLAFAFAFLFPPLHSALHWGQPTPLLLLLLVGSWACARRGWEMSAGTLLAIATLLKIFPWVVCGYFLFRRRWKVLASSLICALAISLCLLALYGIDRNLDFLRGTQISAIWLDRRRNLSIIGNLHAIVVGMSGEGRTLDLRLLGLLIAFFCLSIVSVSGILTSRLPNEPAETSGLCWSLWIMSSILLSPVAWDHYLVLLIPMYIFLASQMALDLKNNAFCQMNRWSVLVGASLLVCGLFGFLSIPYFAAARHAHGYLIFVLTSYVGLCVMLAATEEVESSVV
jgi:hypothetical protein